MSYTTARTWVSGEVVTAALLNTHLRDNVAWLSTDKPMCRVYNDANQTLTHNTETALACNSELFDNATMHSTSASNSRITIPTGGAGKYIIGGTVGFAADGTGTRTLRLRLGGSTFIAAQRNPPLAGDYTYSQVGTLYEFAAAGYVELLALQSSGGDLAVSYIASLSPQFWALWVGV